MRYWVVLGVFVALLVAAGSRGGVAAQLDPELHPYQQAVMELNPRLYITFDQGVEPLVGGGADSVGSYRLVDGAGVTPGGAAFTDGLLNWNDDRAALDAFVGPGDMSYEFWSLTFQTDFVEPVLEVFTRDSVGRVDLHGATNSVHLATDLGSLSASAGDGLTPGRWHHTVIVVERASTGQDLVEASVSLYLDGALRDSAGPLEVRDFRTILGQGTNVLARLNAEPQGAISFAQFQDPSLPLGFHIDELAVYDFALSEADVVRHFELAELQPLVAELPGVDIAGLDPTVVQSYPDVDASTPACLVQVPSEFGWCFPSASERSTYIEEIALGQPLYGAIWIGRFDEEVVAP